MKHKAYFSLFPVLILSFALAFGAGMACYLISGFYIEQEIGRPSSTSAIVLVFFPVYTVIFAVGGGILGAIVAGLLWITNFRTISRRAAFLFTLFLLVGLPPLGPVIAYLQISSYETRNQPAVINSSGFLKKTMVPERKAFPEIQSPAKPAIAWNQNPIRLDILNWHTIQIQSDSGERLLETSLKEYDYIRSLDAKEVAFVPGRPAYLAVLAELRATSHRTMLLIYDPACELIHQEMLSRECEEIVMAVERNPDTQKDSLLIYNEGEIFEYTADSR